MAVNDQRPFVDGYPLPAAGLNSLAPLENPVFPDNVRIESGLYFSNLPNATLSSGPDGAFVYSSLTVQYQPNVLDLWGGIAFNFAGPSGGKIGSAGLAEANNASAGTGIWGGYFEGRRQGNIGGQIYGMEADSVNNGPDVILTPYNAGSSPGYTVTGLFAAGAALSPANPTSAGVVIANNTQTNNKGVLFGSDALTASIGAGGNGVAIEMAPGQSMRWLNSGAGTDAEIWGSAEGLEVGPHGIVLSAVAEPASPGTGKFVIYMDIADNTLKAKGPTGVVTQLAP